jgi:A/G-specific adenine glycosylase
VWAYYEAHGRNALPWRILGGDGHIDPYHVMVSEIMLQQTQVGRVIPKYEQFLARFPDVQSLAAAPLADVLTMWSGLGYNRRAKFLWQAAQMIVSDYNGTFPKTAPELVKLPGIGINTAGAIVAYAFDRPVTFIETNVRAVFIHHFFADEADISDKQLLPLLQQIMDNIVSDGIVGRTPRTWHWALMDYGTHLKQTVGNMSRQSKTYAKQSTFKGSKRQVRGQILKILSETDKQDLSALRQSIADERLESVIEDLIREEFISLKDEHYHLGSA